MNEEVLGENAEKQVIGVKVNLQDMTQIEFESQVAARVLLTNFASRPLFTTDRQGTITYCNQTAAEALQVDKPSGAMGQTLKSLVSIKSHQIVDQVISSAFKAADNLVMPLLVCQIRQRMANTKGAQILDLEWVATAHFSSDGQVQGVVLQLQVFPLLALAVDYFPDDEECVIKQQNNLTAGIFNDDLKDIAVQELVGEDTTNQIITALKAGEHSVQIKEAVFATSQKDHLMRWAIDVSYTADQNNAEEDEVELLFLLQLLGSVSTSSRTR